MKIYTRKGDEGKTQIFGGIPFSKCDPRIDAYGEVDSLNSVVGCLRAFLEEEDLDSKLKIVQDELFLLGTELASHQPKPALQATFLTESSVRRLEEHIDVWEENLPPLKNFILPGGAKASAFSHLARTTCRSAERKVVALGQKEEVRGLVIKYLNRLSDYFFVMSRVINQSLRVSDVPRGVMLRHSSKCS